MSRAGRKKAAGYPTNMTRNSFFGCEGGKLDQQSGKAVPHLTSKRAFGYIIYAVVSEEVIAYLVGYRWRFRVVKVLDDLNLGPS